jgi:hypothetical protein
VPIPFWFDRTRKETELEEIWEQVDISLERAAGQVNFVGSKPLLASAVGFEFSNDKNFALARRCEREGFWNCVHLNLDREARKADT